MKLSSNGYVKVAFEIKDKVTNRHYDCFIQDYEYSDGEHETRFNIGINGYNEWSFICYVSQEKFNELYEVV